MVKYMACKEIVEEGLIVGDGKSINVWSDRWLPKPYFFMRHRCDYVMLDKLRVEMLIANENGLWNKEVISYFLGEEMVHIISGRSLSKMSLEDKLIWEAFVNDKFSVRSAY